jgi:hypothetical protein
MTMTRSKIEDSITEARRFIVKAQAAIERIDAENEERDTRFQQRYEAGINEAAPPIGPQPHDHSWGSAETGALRRASLDLTRNLAELRK